MFLSSDTMAYLFGLGLNGEQLVELVRRLETDALSVQAVDSMREKKRERDRDRYHRRKSGETGAKTDAEIGAEIRGETDAKSAPDAAAKDAHTRGEDNPSRLDTTGFAAAVAAEAREPGSDWPSGKAADHAVMLVELAASPRLDPAKQQKLVLTTGRLEAWRREGASWEFDVIPTVTTLARARGSPIKTWQFFDDAIAESIAANRRALDIPTANGLRHERPDQPSAKRLARDDNHARAFAGLEAAARMRTVGG